jgi:hypothetical protein
MLCRSLASVSFSIRRGGAVWFFNVLADRNPVYRPAAQDHCSRDNRVGRVSGIQRPARAVGYRGICLVGCNRLGHATSDILCDLLLCPALPPPLPTDGRPAGPDTPARSERRVANPCGDFGNYRPSPCSFHPDARTSNIANRVYRFSRPDRFTHDPFRINQLSSQVAAVIRNPACRLRAGH